jgi:hypothetical protein
VTGTLIDNLFINMSGCPQRWATGTRWRPMARLAITLACGDYDRTRAAQPRPEPCPEDQVTP